MKTIVTPSKFFVGLVVAALVLAVQTSSPADAQTGARPSAEADKLHVILLVNGTDKSIGASCLRDIHGVRKTVTTALAKDKNRLVLRDLTGKNPKTGRYYTANEIVAYLKNMKIGKNDNVLIYHAGHGGISDMKKAEQTHMLYIDGGSVSRWQIEQIVLAKQPRSLIVLTDCCSSMPRSVAEADAVSLPRSFGANPNVHTVRNLLLKVTGFVSITAALDGKEAADGSGANPAKASGAFTMAFLRLMYRSDVTYNSWSQFFPVLRSETGKASGGKQLARAFKLPK